jgi:hypothetical protein
LVAVELVGVEHVDLAALRAVALELRERCGEALAVPADQVRANRA